MFEVLKTQAWLREFMTRRVCIKAFAQKIYVDIESLFQTVILNQKSKLNADILLMLEKHMVRYKTEIATGALLS